MSVWYAINVGYPDMISSGRLSDRKQFRIKTYCFWISEGNVFIDKSEAKGKYVATNLICRNCKGCQG